MIMGAVGDLLGVPELLQKPAMPKVESEPQLDALLVATTPKEIRAVNVLSLATIVKDLPDACFTEQECLMKAETILCIHHLFSQLTLYFKAVNQVQPNGTYQLHEENTLCDGPCKAKRFILSIGIFLSEPVQTDDFIVSLHKASINLLYSLKGYFQKQETSSKKVDQQIQAFDLAWRAYLLQRA